MIPYLAEVIDYISPRPGTVVDLARHKILLEDLTVELARLDPRDFAAVSQAQIVFLRAELKTSLASGRGNVSLILQQLKEVLLGYGGMGSHLKGRTFTWITDPELSAMVSRDYKELSLGLLPSHSWKSAVILSGSILEAILYSVLMRDAAAITRANSASCAPKKKGISILIEQGKWTLASLIEVATEIGLLTSERSKAIDQALRDYRNFVHPQKEIRAKHACGEAEALLAKGGLDCVCNHLDAMFP